MVANELETVPLASYKSAGNYTINEKDQNLNPYQYEKFNIGPIDLQLGKMYNYFIRAHSSYELANVYTDSSKTVQIVGQRNIVLRLLDLSGRFLKQNLKNDPKMFWSIIGGLALVVLLLFLICCACCRTSSPKVKKRTKKPKDRQETNESKQTLLRFGEMSPKSLKRAQACLKNPPDLPSPFPQKITNLTAETTFVNPPSPHPRLKPTPTNRTNTSASTFLTTPRPPASLSIITLMTTLKISRAFPVIPPLRPS